MKKMKTIIALFLAACLLLALAACGSSSSSTTDTSETPDTSSETSEAVSSEEEEETEEVAASLAGSYSCQIVNSYGDNLTVTVMIKDSGDASIITLDDAGNVETYTCDSWTDNGDGSFTTSAINEEIDWAWIPDDGSITWVIDGETVTPAEYVEPSDFLEKTDSADPQTVAEAVGIYVFAQVNSFGSTVPYVLWVNGDGTVTIYMNNSFTGLRTYTSDEWYLNDDGTLHIGATEADSGTPFGDWFIEENDYASDWNLYGNGTCTPVGFEDEAGTVDVSELPEEIYPADADAVGIYVFAQVNSFGSTVPYVLWVNGDGTVTIYMNNSFTGLRTYTSDEWYLNDDGTLHIGATEADSGTPFGDWFIEENDYASDWTLYSNGTCVPVGFEDEAGTVDVSELPEDIYPQ